ncbi:MAG: hypothetical protein GF328_13775 [Candidatus Latescibacteria bacterium]|nr:hypothetical protein [Candidatus Latescibacterota bacterium]
MANRLMGVESEYALVEIRSDRSQRDPRAPSERMLGLIYKSTEARVVSLPGLGDGGIFLGNGGRFYIDAGGHPEFCTPECDNPWDVVRYVQAGDRILQDALTVAREGAAGIDDTFLLRTNVDYGGTGSTWGCHESYLHRIPRSRLAEQLIPHLVTRVIYTGAGGFHPMSPGLQFSLSPRIHHLPRVRSDDSTANRGLFHDKNEPLNRSGFARLHLLCGESLYSQTSSWLKIGTTAVVVALIEAGVRPGDAVKLSAPLTAARRIATDPTLRFSVPVTDGRRMRAIAIQRHYLELAEAHLGAETMPPWAGEVCRAWREILDRLEAGNGAVSRTLDWAIKLPLYMDRVARNGFRWESLPRWSTAVRRLRTAIDRERARGAIGGQSLPAEVVVGPNSPIPATRDNAARYLARTGSDLADLPKFLNLRRDLLAVDTQFGRLGPEGLFARLDEAGVLCHRVHGIGDVMDAVRHPPHEGRAHLRGRLIQHLHGQREFHVCNWERIWDRKENRTLDMGDPFSTTEGRWEEYEPSPREFNPFFRPPRSVRNRAPALYDFFGNSPDMSPADEDEDLPF